ncbi:putative aarF domain-containing protein kinase 4 [Cichlidogyrus casuarinus]|uniref:AarF domain-containing protein kinase 4 n=1 Tax=Cichlidogyrus casuarinus TaxID=1844966 RepID=A0ABD2QFA7_9PLAT
MKQVTSQISVLPAQSAILIDELRKPIETISSPKKVKRRVEPLIVNSIKVDPIPKNLEKEQCQPAESVALQVLEANLAIGVGMGALGEVTRRTLGMNSSTLTQAVNPFLTDANLERLVDTLCRMRGAALKLGQMISIQDESLIPPHIQKIFDRVRQAADFMPVSQMHRVLKEEFGQDWRSLIDTFEDVPFAAASIGQVHMAQLHDGTRVAVKIQYPGVADSINADIDNLMMILERLDVFPKGLFAGKAIAVAKAELHNECNYEREAEYALIFRELLKDDPIYIVPKVYPEFTSRYDKAKDFDQEVRNYIGEQLLRLCLKELFVYFTMQTDPNWSNFLYNPKTGKIALLDFGASRKFDKAFVDDYIKVIHAAAIGDKESILEHSKKLGFLTGYESKVMEQAHVDAVSILGEAFASEEPFNFGKQSTTKRINALVPVMLEHRLTPPPDETYSLHRKMSGCFLLCSKLGAVVSCKDLFDEIYSSYQF